MQKTYTFPRISVGDSSTSISGVGPTVVKTLAPPTPERLQQFLDFFGKKSFRELAEGEGQAEYGYRLLELALDLDKLRDLLAICLQEGADDIELRGIDTRLTDEAIQDFFEQRARKLRERINL